MFIDYLIKLAAAGIFGFSVSVGNYGVAAFTAMLFILIAIGRLEER